MGYNVTMTTKAKQQAVERYNAKTYERLAIRIRKDEAEEIKSAIGERSINGFVVEAIHEKIEREKSK